MLSFRVTVILSVITTLQAELRTDQAFWTELAKNELEEALQVKWNHGTAKNVILFVGDGMGTNTVTATRIYKGGETHRLAYERFPHVGLLKTYSANKMVPDSASTASALFCGVKVNQETVGVDASVKLKDCRASLQSKARLKSLAALALEAGKSAGLVTTMRVTHATPSPLYAHSAHRKWECETKMPTDAADCKDIARQLVEDWPGRDLQVIMGGGRQVLVSNSTSSPQDPIDTWSGWRQDGRNLIEEYKKDKLSRGLKYSYVTNNQELHDLNFDDTDYLLGIFGNSHLKYEYERDRSPLGQPSISDMTEAAIRVLRNNKKGFFLMVEGGNIDMGHHRGKAKKAINESSAMEEAVQLALNMTNEEDTLVIVTSDHSHTLSINGYPFRGSNVFGVTREEGKSINYTTLSYGTGGAGSFQYHVVNQTSIERINPTDTDSFDYEQIAPITLSENAHGGGDVAVYSKGPQAHLFHNVHEQHYVFHVISYAAKIGAYSAAINISANLMLCVILTCFWKKIVYNNYFFLRN